MCCPIHREVKESWVFADANDFPSLICPILCSSDLSCGHECQLRCHWSDEFDHKEKCDQKIANPCPHHLDKSLQCHEITRQTRQTLLSDALPLYRCAEIVEGCTLPTCGHKFRDTCANFSDFIEGNRLWPNCEAPADEPLELPCGHLLKGLSCNDDSRLRKTIDKIQCRKKVLFPLPCGHSADVMCCIATAIRNGAQDHPNCSEIVDFVSPTCGHPRKVPCYMEATHKDKERPPPNPFRAKRRNQFP